VGGKRLKAAENGWREVGRKKREIQTKDLFKRKGKGEFEKTQKRQDRTSGGGSGKSSEGKGGKEKL